MRKWQQPILARRRARRRGMRAAARSGCAAYFALPLIGVLVAALVLAGAWLWVSATTGLPSIERLPLLLDAGSGTLLQPTRLYYRDGQTLLYSLENPGIPRRYLALDPEKPEHFSPLLVQVQAFARDPGFWAHPGVTWESLFSAQPVTLAERLADGLLLDEEAPGWKRALRARLLAVQITRRYGRAQVLEWYLNSAGYGHLAYGADSAAQLYLGKSAAQLSLAEAALLVAVEEAPALNPLDAPAAALENQRGVLDRLLQRGVISQEDYLTARAEALQLETAAANQRDTRQPANLFTRQVLEQLTDRYGLETLERGGLRVITTLDGDLQAAVECAAQTQLARLSGAAAPDCPAARLLPTLPGLAASVPQGSRAGALVVDVTSGEVLAYAGDEPPISQPGSLLTPFVALSGFARGLGPASLVWDIPAYAPQSAAAQPALPEQFRGPQRLRVALATDSVAPFAHLLEQVGSQTAWSLAGTLGLRGLERESDPAGLLYRGGDVEPLALARAYTTFARLGQQTGAPDPRGGVQPVLVRAVQTGDGRLLQEAPQVETISLLAGDLAYLAHDILRDEAARGDTLGQNDPLEIGRPAAGKTGQADDGRQVWAVGYTPQRLALAWLALPADAQGKLQPVMAAGIWRAAILSAVADLPAEDWTVPAGVVMVDVCDPSGLLPTPDCPTVVSELFLSGSEPQGFDTLYRRVQVNRETGRRATVFTPPGVVEEQVFLTIPPEARAWAESAGLPQPPQDYDAIRPARANPNAQIGQPEMFAYVRGQLEIRGTAGGEDFVSYQLQVGQGLNPQSWLRLGDSRTELVENGVLGIWDTTGLDGLWALRLQVERTANRLDTAIIQVTVDNVPPQARILYPTPNMAAEPSAQGTVTLQIDASDNIGVARVEWLIDGRMVGENTAAPFSLPWDAARGGHEVRAVITDLAGNQVETPPVQFQVP